MSIMQRRIEVPMPILVLMLIITLAALAFGVMNSGEDSLSGTVVNAPALSIDSGAVVNELNARRSSPLSNNGALNTAAQNYAAGLANNAPGDMGALISGAGYQATSWFFANAFAGYDMSPTDLLNTLGGYGQLTDSAFSDAGVGFASGGGRNYYVIIVAKGQGGGGGSQPPAPPQESRADSMLGLVNNLRSGQGACALTINEQLTQAALAHSRDMAGVNGNAPFLSHTGSNGSTLGSRAAAAGYPGNSALGENVLNRFDVSDQGAYDQWFNSPGHYSNMINRAFTEIGIAYVGPASDGAYYYTMVLGSSTGGCG